jgi:hypothetical protein
MKFPTFSPVPPDMHLFRQHGDLTYGIVVSTGKIILEHGWCVTTAYRALFTVATVWLRGKIKLWSALLAVCSNQKVVYLLNRSPTRSVEGITPFEAWFRNKPTFHHLHMVGCIVHVKNTTPNLKKLEDRSRLMVFIGYEPGTKAYRAYDPMMKKVHVSREVIFNEQAQQDMAQGGIRGNGVDTDMFSVEMEYTTTVLGAPAAKS